MAVTSGVIATLIEEARRAGEHECCGLLMGEPADLARITRVLPAANIHPEPARFFEIDPLVLIAAHRAARTGGPALLGFYHSHPRGHPLPSPADCDHAGGDGRIWAIIAGDAVRWWRDTPQGFVETRLQAVAA